VWGAADAAAPTLHRRKLMLRVAVVVGETPAALEKHVASRLEQVPTASRRLLAVGNAPKEGLALGPIPGSTPHHEIWVIANDRLYRISAFSASLDAETLALLGGLHFTKPTGDVASLNLPDGNSEASLGALAQQATADAELATRPVAPVPTTTQAVGGGDGAQGYGEYRLAEGCWTADSGFFVQTQHGKFANQRWGAGYTGWTVIGRPNFWNGYTHGSLGYGRCIEPNNTNDKFAIDYPLGGGDVIFSPFKGGTVTFPGRNYTHADYGIMVVIRADNGKYVSLSGHLSALARGIRRGAYVTDATIIGYAGATGGSIAVGEPHLHQAFYRYPSFGYDGAPYGGASLQVVNHHYVGTAAGTKGGVYKLGWQSNKTTWSKGDWISN
jgi:hypothetical protein